MGKIKINWGTFGFNDETKQKVKSEIINELGIYKDNVGTKKYNMLDKNVIIEKIPINEDVKELPYDNIGSVFSENKKYYTWYIKI